MRAILLKKRFRVRQFIPILFFTLISLFFISSSCLASTDGVSYSAHVQDYGWKEPVTNGQTAGTVEEAKRIEALKISLINPIDLGISYQVHVQDIGWMDPVNDGAIAGTEGQSKRLEAIRINLTGKEASNYKVFYRVHCQDLGWLGWAQNGQNAGTVQKSLRIEGIEIKVLRASDPAPEPLGQNFVEGIDNPIPVQAAQGEHYFIRYKVFSNGSWSDFAQDGAQLGGDQIDAISATIPSDLAQFGGLEYRTLNADVGWCGWVPGGEDQVAGVAGHGIQAIRMKFTGKLAHLYDIYYRVHVPNVGWSRWGKNGEACGSEALGRNISIVQITLTNKGDLPAPEVGGAFTQAKWLWPLPSAYRGIASPFGPRSDNHHDGIDVSAPEWTPCYAVKDGVIKLSQPNGNFGNCVCLELDSGETLYYGHLVQNNCSVGDRVVRGQTIGFVGTTGNALFYHLHLEVYSDDGSLMNPMSYF